MNAHTPEPKRVDCRNCGGDGYTQAARPHAMHTLDMRCAACKGTGKESAPLAKAALTAAGIK